MTTKIINHYGDGKNEQQRMNRTRANRLEFLTTMQALQPYLNTKIRIADIGCGAGAYALEFAKMEHDVTAVDPVASHIKLLNSEARGVANLKTMVGNALELELPSASFDLVVACGPFYHLRTELERKQCLNELIRILKPGGILAIAYINKHFAVPYYLKFCIAFNSETHAELKMPNWTSNWGYDRFMDAAYFTTPEQMLREIDVAGLEVIDHLGSDGIFCFVKEEIEEISEEKWQALQEYHYQNCREKSILGVSNHGLVIARKI